MVDWRAVGNALRHVAGQPLADADEIAVLELLCERAQEALGAAGVGVLLQGEHGALRHAASSGPWMEQLARVQVKTGEGPAWECVESLRAVVCEDLAREHRWPALVDLMAGAGPRSLACFPLTLGDRCLGTMLVAQEHAARFAADDLEAGEALAAVAAALLDNLWGYSEAVRLADQLETALRTRIVIEQAKGMLAAKLGTTPDEAFGLLRRTARNRRERLHDLAREVIAGTADLDR